MTFAHRPRSFAVDGNLQLYPAQKQGVLGFLTRQRPRMILAYGTGCGKTPTAITAVTSRLRRAHGTLPPSLRILVLCPAIVRHHWKHEFARWANLEAHVIEMGRKRASGTKAQRAARDAAYAANVQVVSYDLAAHVDATGWDAIVFDEIHHVSDCQSKQSRVARYLMLSNPEAVALGLSATLIPTHVWQLWHPLYLLFGEAWGKPPRAGKIAWSFVKQYCELLRNDYGMEVGPLLPGAEDKLRDKLRSVAHRLTREDIADDLPPIDISPLEMPAEDIVENAVEWVTSLENDVTHAVVLVYHRDIAQKIMDALAYGRHNAAGAWHYVRITGEMTTAFRVHLLDGAEKSERTIVIATTESIREGIRLMWAQKVLLAEWRQSPKQVLQVLGRFNSVGDRRRPQIQVLVNDDSWGAAQKLLSRMSSINSLIKAGGTESAIEHTFASAGASEAAILRQTHAMLAEGPKSLDSDWLEDTGEDDEW